MDYSARQGAVVSVNMFLESFHRTLKVILATKKKEEWKNGRLGRMDVASRELVFARISHQLRTSEPENRNHSCEPENSYRLSEIHKRHRKSENIPLTLAKSNCWSREFWRLVHFLATRSLKYE